MKPVVRYDPEADALYVQLAEGSSAKTKSLDDLRMFDLAADGIVLGVEFIGVSEGVDLSGIPFAAAVEKAIGDSGLTIRLFA